MPFLIAAVVIIIFCAVLIIIFKSPAFKGKRGESAVTRKLGQTITGQQYVINNLLFADEAGKSCQIDHIYINTYGIWVIETKNYSGNIYGEENAREWTQVLANGNVENSFYNPIKQNNTHIYRLSSILNVKNVFQNIVVFSNKANISHLQAKNVYPISALKTIKSIKTDIRLTTEQMEQYYNTLLNLKNSNGLSTRQHVKNIHKMQSDIKKGICPRCGGNLILRNGSYGQFYGCSNYPKCKFTKKN